MRDSYRCGFSFRAPSTRLYRLGFSAVAIGCLLRPAVQAAVVVIDYDITIDSTNSFPDPGPGVDPLVLNVIDGMSGSTNINLVNAGSIGGFVFLHDTSHLLVSGGEIDALTSVLDNANLTLAGGSIAPRARWYDAADAAGVIRVVDSGTVNLRGGEFFGTLSQDDSSVVNIFGHSFIVDGELPSGSSAISGVRVRGMEANLTCALVGIPLPLRSF